MIFPSHIFLLVFLPAVLMGWYALRSLRLRLLFLTAASYLFYAWWDYRFTALMLGSTLLDFYCGRGIHRARRNAEARGRDSADRVARRWLTTSIAGNLAALGFFKYYDFFTSSLQSALETFGVGASLPLLDVVLPVGISFYTFQSMSYSIDVYRGKCEPTDSFLRFSAFVSLFPQLVAGPIVRYTDIADQFTAIERRQTSFERIADGIWLFVLGMAKKILIADSLAPVAALAFDAGTPVQFATAWVGAIAFTFQLYYDFSGYSDMARGLGMMLGFEFPINFNSPYKAASISEFWNRWHITLSSWLRDYLYIPLGGSRASKIRTARNLSITMFLGGLWHGAAWHFVAWGLYHGLLLAIHSTWKRTTSLRLPRAVAVGGTFLLVVLGWVLFRANSLDQAVQMYAAMVGLNGLEPLTHHSVTLNLDLPALYGLYGGANGVLCLGVIAALAFFAPNSQDLPKPRHYTFAVAAATAVIVMITGFQAESPFLYYQF